MIDDSTADPYTKFESNSWVRMVLGLKRGVITELDEEGQENNFRIDEEDDYCCNAYQCLEIVEHILDDSVTLPCWSSMMEEKFEYGSVPASTSEVENQIRYTKHQTFTKEELPIRVDRGVEKQMQVNVGKCLRVNAALDRGELISKKIIIINKLLEKLTFFYLL